MFRIDSTGHTVDYKFTEGDPVHGVPPTVVSADWLNNTVQEELCGVVEAAGLTLDKTDHGQLLKAIIRLLGGYACHYARGNNYTNLANFLAGAYVSVGICQSRAGEIRDLMVTEAGDSMLYSMVVHANSVVAANVYCLRADDNVDLYLDGVLQHNFAAGGSGAAYTLNLTAADHVVQFLNHNGSAGYMKTLVNDWMTGNDVDFLRAALA